MYKITIQTLNGNEKTLYYPGNDEFTVLSASLSLKVGNAGEFKFTVPQSNPLYNEIVDRSIITIYEDNLEIWRGDIQDISQNFDKSLEVYALEDLAWLGDETVPMVAVENQTYAQRFSTVMANYNDNQPAKRQFVKGQLTSVTTTNTCHWEPQYEENLLNCIRRCIADDGYLKIRRVTQNGTVTRYLDILRLEDYGQQADQKIEFGANLLDFVKEIDNTNFLNVLYPYGAETEENLYGDIMKRMEGTPIQNDASIAAFGRHARSVVFETESLARLNSLALAYLNRYSQPSLKIRARAIDLGNIEAIARLHIGDSVRVVAPPFAVDQWDYITNQDLDLLNIANNQIELSDSIRTTSLTSQVATQAEELKDLQTPASVLDAAKKNAWAILEGDNGGIVTFEVNGSEQIVGIHIANNLDLTQATKAWGWNLNGLVYMHRTYASDPWTIGIAMTMNGEIVADYITTGTLDAAEVNVINLNADNIKSGSISANRVNFGTMQANRISGGSMVVGGVNNEEGTITSVASIAWDGDPTTLSQYDTATFAVGITVYEAVWLRVTATGQSTGNIVGRYRINSGAWQDLRVGDTLIGTFNTTTYITVDALYHSLSFYKGLATVKTYIDNSGVVADNLVARNSGYIGDLVINGRELFETGDYIIAEKSYTGNVGGKILTKFVPSKLYITESSFYISLTYSINHSPGDGYNFYLEYYSNGWLLAQHLYQRFDEGTYTITFDNVQIQSNDTRNWRIRLSFSTLGINSQFTAKVFIPNVKILSLSDDGIYGSFIGRFTGAGDFDDNTSICDIEFDNSHIYVSDTTEYFDVAKSGFKSAVNNNNYTKLSCNKEAVISAYKSSSEYVRLKTSNPSIKVYDSSTEYIDISKSSMRLESSSSDFCIFRGDSNLAASDSGTSYYISWVQGSDRRIKEEIEPLDVDLSRNLIDATAPKKFKYKSDDDGKHYGMIAQEARELLDSLGEEDAMLEFGPKIESEDIPNYRAIHYEEYIPHLINYVKDLRSEIVSLKEEVRILKEEKNDGKH